MRSVKAKMKSYMQDLRKSVLHAWEYGGIDMKRNLRGTGVVIGCCLQAALALGFSCAYISAYSLLPEAYGISFTFLGTLASVMSFVGFIAVFTSASVIKKIKPRGAIMATWLIIMSYGIFVKFIPNSTGLMLAMSIGGLLTGWSGLYLTNEIIAAWFVEKRATMLGIVNGAVALGVSAYFALGGWVFGKFGIQNGFFVLAAGTVVVLAVNGVTLLRYPKPEMVGLYPDGKTEALVIPNAETATEERMAVPTADKFALYKNPGFWIFVVLSVLAGVYVSYVQSYCTIYLTEGGIEYSLAATILSVLGMLSGIYVMFSGRLLEKIGIKPYIFASFVCALLADLCVVVFLKMPSIGLVAVLIVTYTFGYAACMSTTYLIYNPQIVKPENAFNVNSKSGAVLLMGNIVLQPAFGAIKDNCGTGVVFAVCAGSTVLGIIMLTILFRFIEQRGAI